MGAVLVMDRAKLAAEYDNDLHGPQLMNDEDAVGESKGNDGGMMIETPFCLFHGEPCVLLACKHGANIGKNVF